MNIHRLLCLLGGTALFAGGAFAQSTINEGSSLSHDPSTGAYTFAWQGQTGRTYFIQQSEDLVAWVTFPIIEVGAGQPISYGFTSNAPRIFFRLRYSDLPAADVRTADFDGDGVSNWDEVQQSLDPFNPDTDKDGMPDGYELANGMNPRVADGTGNLDGDYLVNLAEFVLGTNPNVSNAEVTSTSLGMAIYTPLE